MATAARLCQKIAMRPLLILPLLALLGAAPAPRRILSLNLCADQLLISLAEPVQVVGLTRLARDPSISAAAVEAKAFRTAGSTAEDVLAAEPDLILTGWPGQADTALRLGARARVLVVPPANSYADIVAQVRSVAAAIGRPDRGRALIARMDRQLAAIVPGRRRGVAADYQRRGFLTGQATLVDEMMRRAGLTNLAEQLGRPPLSVLSIEEMVAARPDFLIVDATHDDLGSAMIDHPALRGIRRLRLASAFTTCGGASFPRAVELLVRQAGG